MLQGQKGLWKKPVQSVVADPKTPQTLGLQVGSNKKRLDVTIFIIFEEYILVEEINKQGGTNFPSGMCHSTIA